MNRGELKNLLREYLHDQQVNQTLLDAWVDFATYRLNQICRPQDILKTVEITFDEVSKPLPTDYTQMQSVVAQNPGGGLPLDSYSISQLRQVFIHTNIAGRPQGYAVFGKTIEVRPWAAGLKCDLQYFGRLAHLTSDNATNEVLTEYPSAYLYGALIEGYAWSHNPEAREAADQEFHKRVAAINEETVNAQIANWAGQAG